MTATKQHSTTRKRRGATCDAQITDAKPHSTARKRRGATCDARMTATKQHSTTHKRRGATRDARMTDAKQQSTTRKRRGATCDARMTDAMPQTNRRPAHIRQHATRPTTCAVPAPGVMNGAPTGYATNQPPPRPHPPIPNATGQLCRSGTGRHKWRPHGLRREPAAIHDGRGDGTHTVCPVRGAMCSLRTGQVACRCGRRGGQRSAAISSAFASSASRAICKLRSAMS